MELTEAIHHALDGNSILFVGAGFSRSAVNINGNSLKTGAELARHLAKECDAAETYSLESIAEYYIETHGKTKLVNLLRNEFSVSRIDPSHQVIGGIPWKRVYTTNYDDVVEQAYRHNRRATVSITLADKITRVREDATQCVHINGYVNSLSEESLDSEFKLSDSSYATSSFENSEWCRQFRHDISSASSIFFIGYSAYDLDIKRIIVQSKLGRDKIQFAVGRSPDNVTHARLGKFGCVLAEDTTSLAELFKSAASEYSPRTRQSPTGRYIVEIEAPEATTSPRDSDAVNLLLWGKLDRRHVWNAVSEADSEPYVCVRDSVHQCLQWLEDGERNIVVRSALGNGKSLFLESLGAMAVQYGYRVFHLEETGQGSVAEVEVVAKCEDKTLLLIDGYTSKRAEIEALSAHRSDQLRVVYAARTLKHDVSFEWLNRLLDVAEVPEIDIDYLTQIELSWFGETLDHYGLWGDKAGWSKTRKVRHLQSDANAELSSILVSVLNSKPILDRLKSVVDAIGSAQSKNLQAVASILALTVIEIGTNFDTIIDLIGADVLNQAQFRTNDAVRELIDFNRDTITARSSVIGQHLLRYVIDPADTVSALVRMAKNADNFRNEDKYFQILRELMRFANVQSILPDSNKMNAVFSYYERIKNFPACSRNPDFWLQYAIARLAVSAFADARIKLKTAYSHASNKEQFDTYMLDNTSARLDLEELIAEPASDQATAIACFRRARTVVNQQITLPRHRHYPFRVAEKYSAFLSRHWDVLGPDGQQEVARAARFVLRRISTLTAERARHRSISECKRAMMEIDSRVPRSD